QQRAAHKYHSGGLWANACCSHPRPEEALADAAARRLQEECGAVCPLTELFSFVYRQPFADGLCEYEVDHVLLGRYDGPLTRNPDEAAQLLWIERDELAERLLTRPQDFAAWFVIAAPRVLALTAR
ncbi:MAG: NUDIX domain-containing protein, partial [Oscillospiraceae bacterium]